MPTSSTNRRLTYEFYKPPPKSLQEIRLEQKNDYRDSDRSGSHSSFLKREKYRNSFSEKQTAIVTPVNDGPLAAINGRQHHGNHNNANLGKGNISPPFGGITSNTRMILGGVCCRCHGCCCMRWNLLLFLFGLLLGALITGLVIGHVLQFEDETVVAEGNSQNPDACFVNRFNNCSIVGCTYQLVNTSKIDCKCNQSSTAEQWSGFECLLENITTTTPPTSSFCGTKQRKALILVMFNVLLQGDNLFQRLISFVLFVVLSA